MERKAKLNVTSMYRGNSVKHFITFTALGLAAVGSGMVLATHFTLPHGPEVDFPQATTSELSSLPYVDAPSIPASLPDANEAMDGASRAFGEATDTMAHYSNKTFGPTARKIRRSVDEAKIPIQ